MTTGSSSGPPAKSNPMAIVMAREARPRARNGVWRAMDSLPASITATARRARSPANLATRSATFWQSKRPCIPRRRRGPAVWTRRRFRSGFTLTPPFGCGTCMSVIPRMTLGRSIWHLRAFKNPDSHTSSNKLRICAWRQTGCCRRSTPHRGRGTAARSHHRARTFSDEGAMRPSCRPLNDVFDWICAHPSFRLANWPVCHRKAAAQGLRPLEI